MGESETAENEDRMMQAILNQRKENVKKIVLNTNWLDTQFSLIMLYKEIMHIYVCQRLVLLYKHANTCRPHHIVDVCLGIQFSHLVII